MWRKTKKEKGRKKREGVFPEMLYLASPPRGAHHILTSMQPHPSNRYKPCLLDSRGERKKSKVSQGKNLISRDGNPQRPALAAPARPGRRGGTGTCFAQSRTNAVGRPEAALLSRGSCCAGVFLFVFFFLKDTKQCNGRLPLNHAL